MRYRFASLSIAFFLLAALATASPAADKPDKSGDKGKTHTGTVVSTDNDKLVMLAGGKEHSHDVESSAKITLDGKEAKLSELKKGDKIVVTADNTGKLTTIKATRAGGVKK